MEEKKNEISYRFIRKKESKEEGLCKDTEQLIGELEIKDIGIYNMYLGNQGSRRIEGEGLEFILNGGYYAGPTTATGMYGAYDPIHDFLRRILFADNIWEELNKT